MFDSQVEKIFQEKELVSFDWGTFRFTDGSELYLEADHDYQSGLCIIPWKYIQPEKELKPNDNQNLSKS